jgi:L-2,4-diaminobutyrate transaminase
MSYAASHNLSLEQLDKDTLLHPMTALAEHLNKGPLIMQSGTGVRLTDHNGKQYIDASAGLWCVNIGYGRAALGQAAADEMSRLGYFHAFGSSSNEPLIRLADRLLRLLQQQAGAPQMSKIFFGLSGSDGNDTQVKLVRYYNNLLGRPQKKKIISRIGAYHGLTVAAGGLTGIPMYHKAFDLPGDQVVHLSTPHYYRYAQPGESEQDFSSRLAGELEQTILREGADNVAAFIAEPVMGTGGVLLPPAGYFEKIQPILEKYDVLFIADEVICGFGRLGSWFGTGFYQLKPDLITMAKGLTSAYFPMSAVAISDKVWQVMLDASAEIGPFAHGFTYSGHPVGAAVAMANLDIMEGEGLIENAARVGPYLKQQLAERLAAHPHVGEVRGDGLMLAVELIADRDTKTPFDSELKIHRQVMAKALEQGLMVRALPFGDVLSMSPPLTFTEADADQTCAIFCRALDEVMADLKP